MELKVTRYAVVDQVATIELHRPDRLNSWTGRMHTEYRHLLERAEQDPDVRVMVVTGAGRGFCAGADTKALDTHVERGGYDPGTPTDIARPGYGRRPEFDADFAYHFGLRKPLIAAINGAAAGVGLVLACYADIRFAVPGAKLTTAHGKLALPAEYGLSWLLPRLIGVSAATELLITSRVFLTEEAHALGMITRLCEPGELRPVVQDYAVKLARSVAPESIAETKRQIYTDLHRDVRAAVEDAGEALSRMMTRPDYAEGIRAFKEKRPPSWHRD